MAALEQLVGASRARRRASARGVLVLLVHARMVARNPPRPPPARSSRRRLSRSPSRQRARSTGWSRGDSVRPGIRPRLAIGRPSISLMSPVKSIGVAPLMYEPTAYESTGGAGSLK